MNIIKETNLYNIIINYFILMYINKLIKLTMIIFIYYTMINHFRIYHDILKQY